MLFGAALVFFSWVQADLIDPEDINERDDSDEDAEKREEVKYEQSYTLDTAELPETAANLAAGRVEDATPDGRVVLRLQDGLFEYWADKAVAYKYLETVARKYVVVYDRRAEYVNMFRELLKALEAPPPPAKEVAPEYARFRPAKVSTPCVVNERANRYHWMGRLAELDPPPPRELPKSIRYAEYKKKV